MIKQKERRKKGLNSVERQIFVRKEEKSRSIIKNEKKQLEIHEEVICVL